MSIINEDQIVMEKGQRGVPTKFVTVGKEGNEWAVRRIKDEWPVASKLTEADAVKWALASGYTVVR